MAMNDTLTFRVVLVGDSGGGKTSIIQHLARGEFDPHHKTTVGAVFHTISRDINGQRVLMQVWDTAGQEKYRSIGPIYYRNAAAAIAVFDVSVNDFEANLENWIVSVKRSATDPLIYIVGNKVDLLPDETDVTARTRLFAERYQAQYFMTSAKLGTRINLLFDAVFQGLVSSCVTSADVVPQENMEEMPKQTCC
jgi:small GTP-binding protein